jgi:uncharacterized protein YfdQ (DUF2303 family)
VSEDNNAQSIIDAATSAAEPNPLEVGKVYAVAVPSNGSVDVIDLDPEDRLGNPRRKSGTVAVQSANSFVAYVGKHGTASSEVYADRIGKKIVGVLNAGTAAPGELLDEGLAGWGDHRVEFDMQFTDEWKAWLENDGKLLPQVAFAEFIEDHQSDINVPGGAEMLEVAQSIIATSSVNFESTKRLSTGEAQLEYREEINGTAGKGTLEIPTIITLGLRPFEGAVAYAIDARFRYRINGGNLHLAYKLVEPEVKIRDAFESVVNDITEQLGEGALVLDGVAASARRPSGTF